MYEVPHKDTMKSQFLPHLSVAKRGYGSKRDRAEVIQCGLHKQKPLVDGRLLLRLHDVVAVVRELHALQSPALAATSVCVFRAVAMRVNMA